MKYVIMGGIGAIAITGLIAYFISTKSTCQDFKEGELQINGKPFLVAIADTPAEHIRGLGGCTRIPKHSGMYFVYEQPREVAYWMKGMSIPIDIIWISQNKVIGIEEFVPAPTDQKTELLPQYKPPRAVDGVLEIGAGKAQEEGIVIGSSVERIR